MKFYQHYKGGIYKMVGIAKHSESLEEMVVYEGLDGQMWARPRSMFNEILVSSEGLEIERFKYIGEKIPEKSIKKFNGNMRMKFGKFRGHYEWDLAVEWFQTSNDDFFEKYGFNFVPKGKLFDKAKEYVFLNGRRSIQNNVSVEINHPDLSHDEIMKGINNSLYKGIFNKMTY